ncbi:MAG: hypothetical protein ABSD96_16395 [Candidatus Korobacteraceae bacterium]|jgi:hypothetical protein
MSNQKSFQQIWKRMDRERRRQVTAAFFSSTETAGEQRRVAGLIAMKLNLRPQKAAKLPADKSAAYLSAIESIDESLAALLVRTYLFANQQPMLVMFLDELQIPHQNGVIADDITTVPSADALRAAVDRIRTTFPAEDVQLYLSALFASDAVTWANLDAVLTDEKA